MGKTSFGYLGGSFNPIHNGHLYLARQALLRASLCQVVFVPTGTPPHKPQGLAVSDVELCRPGTSYTVDTLAALREAHPGVLWWLVVGADTLMEMLTWKAPETVFQMAGLLLCDRPGTREKDLQLQMTRLTELGARVRRLEVEGPPISSSEIRERIAQGEPVTGLVPRKVETYLRETGLYRGESR